MTLSFGKIGYTPTISVTVFTKNPILLIKEISESGRSMDKWVSVMPNFSNAAFLEIFVPVRLLKYYRGTEALLEPLQNNLTPVLVSYA